MSYFIFSELHSELFYFRQKFFEKLNGTEIFLQSDVTVNRISPLFVSPAFVSRVKWFLPDFFGLYSLGKNKTTVLLRDLCLFELLISKYFRLQPTSLRQNRTFISCIIHSFC